MKRRVRFLVTLITLAPLALAVGCGSDDARSAELAIDEANVTLRYDPSWPPCPGSAKFLDDVAARQAAYLGYPIAPKITYHFVEALAQSPCSNGGEGGGGGCTIGNSVWATFPDLTHELVHAIVIPQKGNSLSFFEEGVAVALGGSDTSGADYSRGVDALFAAGPLPAGDYATAGDFVSYLLLTYGADKLRALFPSVGLNTTPNDADAALERVYGKRFQALVADRQASGLVLEESRLALPECGGAPTPWGDGPTWRYDVTPTCGAGADGIGYLKSEGGQGGIVWRFASVDVPADGLYRLAVNASGEGTIRFRHCLAGEEIPISTVDKATTTGSLEGKSLVIPARLRQGRHYFQTVGQDDPPTTFHLTLDPLPAPPASGCAPPEAIAPDAAGYYLAPSTSGDVIASVRVDAARPALVIVQDATLQICNDCTAGCTAAPLSGRLTLEPGVTYTLVAHASQPRGLAGLAFDF